MREYDIVIVGGSAAGLTAAITARRHHPDKSILLIRRERQVLIPCGIPYIFGTVGEPGENLIPDAPLQKNRIDLLIDAVTSIDRDGRSVETVADRVRYERLILATGSCPATPPITGIDGEGVFTLRKDVDYLAGMQERLATARRVVIIGGGFIGIELADEIRKSGIEEITIIEMLPHCLGLAYDDEFCEEMETHLRDRGIAIRCNTRVADIAAAENGGKRVVLADDDAIDADMVVLGIGAVANVDLAKAAGLRIGATGGVDVDRAMISSDERIFACGDCAEKVSFFGGRPSPLKLASIATMEARIAAANLYGIKRESPGTVGAWSTAVGDLAMGTAGLTEAMAAARGYRCVAATVEGPNRHPGGMPGAVGTRLKLVFEAHSGVLLGGQIRGDHSVGEVVNLISACVQRSMTAEDIAMFQTGTHPALTASPIAYGLVNAAEMAIGKIRLGDHSAV